MSTTVYLVSGANRGIGFGLVKALATRSDTVVFAGTRNPSSATQLQELARQQKNVHILKLTSCDKADNQAAAAEIKKVAGVLHVVIANAGIMNQMAWGIDTPPGAMSEHFDINVNGPLVLFQAAYPLLKASTPTPKFIAISSVAGSIEVGGAMPLKGIAYGASKAALNFVIRKLHHENDGLIAFSICPGGVVTDMSRFTIVNDDSEGLNGIQFKTVEETAAHLLEVFDSATRETDALMNYDGSTYPW